MRFVWNMEQMDQVAFLVSIDIKICPLVAVCPCLGAIYSIKSWKKMYEIRLQGDLFETWNKWEKWWSLSVDIKILSPGVCLQSSGAVYMY